MKKKKKKKKTEIKKKKKKSNIFQKIPTISTVEIQFFGLLIFLYCKHIFRKTLHNFLQTHISHLFKSFLNTNYDHKTTVSLK